MLQLQRAPLSRKQSRSFAWTEAAADGNCHQAMLKQELNRLDTNCSEASVAVFVETSVAGVCHLRAASVSPLCFEAR